ncbi:MAG TPA: TlpA family protein disulfide reductase [Gammaproteobacteria bacterium]|nr:TlpA family protein disulfide reductase [Gammaproteobacteria bacterium]HIK68339.1 TlpA family protein disulfide reductase [Pseudomonadales bacterium]
MMQLKKSLCMFILAVCPDFCLALNEGAVAPGFSLPVFDHPEIRKSSDYLGKVIYLDFWASWCGPCQISVPQLVQLQADLNTDKFEVVAINVDEEAHRARRFLAKYKVNYTVLADPEGRVAAEYELTGMPSAFIVNQQGRIVKIHTGFKKGDMEIIRSYINDLLN